MRSNVTKQDGTLSEFTKVMQQRQGTEKMNINLNYAV